VSRTSIQATPIGHTVRDSSERLDSDDNAMKTSTSGKHLVSMFGAIDGNDGDNDRTFLSGNPHDADNMGDTTASQSASVVNSSDNTSTIDHHPIVTSASLYTVLQDNILSFTTSNPNPSNQTKGITNTIPQEAIPFLLDLVKLECDSIKSYIRSDSTSFYLKVTACLSV
jgi:hypothetical protein